MIATKIMPKMMIITAVTIKKKNNNNDSTNNNDENNHNPYTKHPYSQVVTGQKTVAFK